MIIRPEKPYHAPRVEALLDEAFGPARYAKTAYRLRDGVAPVRDLSFIVKDGLDLVGTLRFWPITVAEKTPALLLGPIAILTDRKSQGIGSQLMRHGLSQARMLGHELVLLVGDLDYYKRFGFTRTPCLDLTLPGPVDTDRWLGLELVPGASEGLSGMVCRHGSTVAEMEALAHRPLQAVAGDLRFSAE